MDDNERSNARHARTTLHVSNGCLANFGDTAHRNNSHILFYYCRVALLINGDNGSMVDIDVISIMPILILTLISMFGVGFMIAGISIIVKQVGAFLQILQFILAALTFIPLTVAPFFAFLPFVKGVDLVRQVMIHGYTLSQFTVADFLILGFNAIVYLTLGLLFFTYCERIAMKKGLLAHY